MSEEASGFFECEADHFKTNVILPNGTMKVNVYVQRGVNVKEEKERLVRDLEVKMAADELKLVLHIGQGGQRVMDDDRDIDDYQEHFPPVELELKRRSAAKDKECHKAFNTPAPPAPPDILPPTELLDITTNSPTKIAITKAIKSLKSGKAAGPDGIPPEVLKPDIQTSTEMLHPLLYKIWE